MSFCCFLFCVYHFTLISLPTKIIFFFIFIYIAKSHRLSAFMDNLTSNSQSIGVNMMSAHLCSYNSFASSRKAFHKVYEWVYGNFGLILKVYLWGQRLMLGEKAVLAVSILVHPKSVLSGWGQDNQVQARRVVPHQSRSYRSLYTWLCALTHSHVGTGRGWLICKHYPTKTTSFTN